MKRDYYYLNNYTNGGEMGISRHAFESIADGGGQRGRRRKRLEAEDPPF
jgi:hypothetical protein